MSLTVILCARDAAATIERAVASVLPERECRLLLVDDGSRDATVERARRIAGERLRVVATAPPGGIPCARQAGLDACETAHAAWLDADDEWIPGRAARIVRALGAGADVFCEAIELYDGATGRPLRRLDVPDFLCARGGAMRLFERNHLPGDTQVGFRVACFRDVGGYDPAVHGAESFDVLLRAVAAGARFTFGTEIGYRMYAYPGSVSRDLARQRAALATALRKHDYDDVRRRALATGLGPRVVGWILVSMALFRGEPGAALRLLDEACPPDAAPGEVLEPAGPWPVTEGWRRAFHRGTALLLAEGDAGEAERELRRAHGPGAAPEAANNLGVALVRLGRDGEARACWELALRSFPGYLDARMNLETPAPARITTHPLRRAASRSEY